MEVPLDNSLHGTKVKHKRTGIIREIYVMEPDLTPSGEAIDGKFDPVYHILYDNYLVNKQFYTLI